MSQADYENQDEVMVSSQQVFRGQDALSQDEKGTGSNPLVPVTEAIKYRKRAQAAEHEVEQLRGELATIKQQGSQSQAALAEVILERDLTWQLLKEGATDVEAAVLLAKRRLGHPGSEPQPMSEVISTLRRDKPYLFSDLDAESVTGPAGSTAGVRSGRGGGIAALTHSARRAAESGSRKDMQDYLRLRRSVRK